jgi:hypothetical protein
MNPLAKDFLRYAAHSDKRNNRWEQVMHFVFKDYPAFLWGKPSLRRIVVFPFLLFAVIAY